MALEALAALEVGVDQEVPLGVTQEALTAAQVVHTEVVAALQTVATVATAGAVRFVLFGAVTGISRLRILATYKNI